MKFEREVLEDEYIKLRNINLSSPPQTMAELFTSAENYRENALQIYQALTHTIYVEFGLLFTKTKVYSDPHDFIELTGLITTTSDESQLDEYKAAYKEISTTFRSEGKKFNSSLDSLLKSIRENCKILEKNMRKDLSSGAFFYGRIEEAMKVRGNQIEEMASVIKEVYIGPINALKDKIKKYNDKIDDYLDPKKNFEAFTNALPTKDEFASLTKFSEKKPDAQVEAMKTAYAVAIKGINYMGNQIINVISMDERSEYQDELSKLLKSYDKYKNEYENIIHEYDMVKSLVAVLDGMKYFAELGKNFTDEFTASSDNLALYLKNGDVKKYYAEIIETEKKMKPFLE